MQHLFNVWQSISVRNRVIVVAATVAMFAAVLALTRMAAAPNLTLLYAGLEQVFERYDAIITPASTGEAPVGLDATGSPVFNSLWTYLGVPAVTLPLLQGENGMPIGVQLVGRKNDDARLLRTARWLSEKVAKAE